MDPDPAPAVTAPIRRPYSPKDAERRQKLGVLLKEHDGNVSEVARALGKARMQIHRWIKKFDIDPGQHRK